MQRFRGFVVASVAFLTSAASVARAESVTVAVAANFLEPLKAMVEPFAAATGHEIEPRPGSTGELYAQITQGAPYDVFLAADEKRPEAIEKEGLGVAGTRFPYAFGRLVLWSRDVHRIAEDGVSTLRAADFAHLAIAEPKTAPYGAAAKQALAALGLWPTLGPKVVYGQNVGQTFQFLTSGSAELGFVALSQISAPMRRTGGSRWLVPSKLHGPIRQDAILLVRGSENPAAGALLDFLRAAEGRDLIRSFGYEVEEPAP